MSNDDSIMWNPYNKVVQSQRTGTIDNDKTNEVRKRLGLPVPWLPEMANIEVRQPAVFDNAMEQP
jgi:hypothetical protein